MREDKKGSYGLTYIKLYIDELELLEAALSPDLAAILLFAVGNYAKDCTIRKVPAEIGFAFADFQRKVDTYRKSCEQKSKQNAKNGAKGGKAKAANAKAEGSSAKTATKFKPPTKQEFKNAVYHLVETEDLDPVDQYDIEVFYDKLRGNGWTIGGKPIQCRKDWEDAINAKFCNYFESFPGYYEAFERVFAAAYSLPDCHLTEYDFFDAYDEEAGSWEIEGEVFPKAKWKDALAAWIAKELPPSGR